METDDYKLTSWKGLANWECKHCQFATVEGLAAMLAHLKSHGLHRADQQVVPLEADEEE